jgi:hypothetical protein
VSMSAPSAVDTQEAYESSRLFLMRWKPETIRWTP